MITDGIDLFGHPSRQAFIETTHIEAYKVVNVV